MPSSTDHYDGRLGLLRIAACLAIVLLHSVHSARILFQESATMLQQLVSCIAVNEQMWAVPIFLMVSGALLLDSRREITLAKAGRYIRRMLLALLVCSIGFRIFDVVMNGEPRTLMSFAKALQEFFSAGGWSPLWYLYLMIGLYLMLPFYHKVTAHCSERELQVLLAVMLTFCSLVPLLKAGGLRIGFYIPSSMIYPWYLLLGHYLRTYPGKRQRAVGLMAMLTASAALAALSAWQSARELDEVQTALVQQLTGYASPLVVLQAGGLFLFCMSFANAGIGRLRSVDACTFGIYLIHMVFIRLVLRYMGWNPYTQPLPVLAFAGFILGVFALSLVIVMVLRRLPFFRTFL